MTALIFGLAGSIITVVGAIIKDQWSKKGTIKTSEATQLWTSMESELKRLTEDTIRYRAELNVSFQEMAAIRMASDELRIRIIELEASLNACSRLERHLRERLTKEGIEL